VNPLSGRDPSCRHRPSRQGAWGYGKQFNFILQAIARQIEAMTGLKARVRNKLVDRRVLKKNERQELG